MMAAAGRVIEDPVTVSLIYDDDFTIDRAATIPSATAIAADGAGSTGFFNHGSASISGGVVNLAASNSAIIYDFAASRDRLEGRIHYCKHYWPTTTDFQSFGFGIAGSVNTESNWWAFNKDDPRIFVKGDGAGQGTIRDDYGGGNGTGTHVWRLPVVQETTYEWAIVERDGVGSFSMLRVDGGDWRIVFFEKRTTLKGKLVCRPEGSGANTIDRLCTAVTDYIPKPLVQHSFASALGPSDGAGQPETGGAGVAAITVGNVTINDSGLEVSADGEGMVIFDTGETEVGLYADHIIYDGSRCGIVVRYVDASNYILCVANSTTNILSIIEVVAGSPTTLASIDGAVTDSYDLPNASALDMHVHIDGNVIRAVYKPGCLHSCYISHETTRFASSTKHGVVVSKGSGVNSSRATNFAAFAQVQNSLPAMVNT